MTWQNRITFYLAIAAAVCSLGFSIPMAAQNPSVDFDQAGCLLGVNAQAVPLETLLRIISQKTGLTLELNVPLGDPVSCDFQALPLEDAIKRLMSGRSYTVSYKQTSNGRFLPTGLRVIGKSGEGTVSAQTGRPEPVAPALGATPPSPYDAVPGPDQHMKRMEKEEFQRIFSDPASLAKKIEASPEGSGPTGGIRITAMAGDSPLYDFGIEEGDVIVNVNGRPVSSLDRFLAALTSPQDRDTLRIECRRDGQPAPIYIRLH